MADQPAGRHDAVLTLHWQGDAAPTVNLYRAADPACTRSYLLDLAAGQAQLERQKLFTLAPNYELEIEGGGVQVFRISMNRAPETGYQPRVRLAYSADDPEWAAWANRTLIARFPDGTYAFLRVSMRMEGDFYVAFDGVWNPTGSTWLD